MSGLTEWDLRMLGSKVAWHYLGTLYRWGGDDPTGFDCSGFAIEVLRSVGKFPRGRDTTAEGLRRLYQEVREDQTHPCDLVFWMRGSKAVHVGLVIEPGHYIGAEGGGSSTTDADAAARQNAYIQVNPIASRGAPADRRFASPFTHPPTRAA